MYDLVGVDGNAFSVMAYVVKAMRREGFSSASIAEYKKAAMSSGYDNLIAESVKYIDMCNERAGYDEDEDEEEG